MNLSSLSTARLGSIDLFDFIIRLNFKRNENIFDKFPTLIHEYVHYIQLVCTPVGHAHLANILQISKNISEIVTDNTIKFPIIRNIEGNENSPEFSKFRTLRDLLCDLAHMWKFPISLPVLAENIDAVKDISINFDISNGSVSFGDIFTAQIGLHSICEHMARAADYVAKIGTAGEKFSLDINSWDDIANLSSDMEVKIRGDIFHNSLPITSLLYDMPRFLALQHQWKSLQATMCYSILVGWIVLMKANWETNSSNPESSPQIGSTYLKMLKDGGDLIQNIYNSELPRFASGDSDALNGVRMADEICKYFKIDLFSDMLNEHINRLSELLNIFKPENSETQPLVNYYWYLNDGLKILSLFKEVPQRFILLHFCYRVNGKEIWLPRPPIFYKDTVLSAEPGGPLRDHHHFALSIQKELLFSVTSIKDILSNEGYAQHNCVYDDNCILKDFKGLFSDFDMNWLIKHVALGNYYL